MLLFVPKQRDRVCKKGGSLLVKKELPQILDSIKEYISINGELASDEKVAYELNLSHQK